MSRIEVVNFTVEREEMTLKLRKEKPQVFDAMFVAAHIMELKKGFKVDKIYKTTKTGTAFKYKPIQSKDEFEEYVQYIDKITQFVKDKYN